MNDQTKQIIATLKRYAQSRQNDVQNHLESEDLSALLVEKYAIGLIDAIRTLRIDADINAITAEADQLCLSIDPNINENRALRYANFSKLNLSTSR